MLRYSYTWEGCFKIVITDEEEDKVVGHWVVDHYDEIPVVAKQLIEELCDVRGD